MTDMSDVITALSLVHQVLKTEPNLCLKHHECRITAEMVIGAYRQLSALAQRGIVRTGTTDVPKQQQLQLAGKDISNPAQKDSGHDPSGSRPQIDTSDHPGELTEPEWEVALAQYHPDTSKYLTRSQNGHE